MQAPLFPEIVRELKGLTREKFCESLVENSEYWGLIERGEQAISLVKLLQVCETYEDVYKRQAYIVLGVTLDGYKDILSITVGANETSKFWLRCV